MKRILLILITLLYSWAGFCQQPGFSLDASVKNKDTKAPIQNVRIHLIGPYGFNTSKVTDSNGHCFFGSNNFKPNASYVMYLDMYTLKSLYRYKTIRIDTLYTDTSLLRQKSGTFFKTWELEEDSSLVNYIPINHSKEPWVIKATVTDNETNKPIYFASVHLSDSIGPDKVFKTDSSGCCYIKSNYLKLNIPYKIFAEDWEQNHLASMNSYRIKLPSYTDTTKYTFSFPLPSAFIDRILRFPRVLFKKGSSALSPEVKDTVLIQNMLKVLLDNSTVVFEIDAHASHDEGSSAQKMALSQSRAQSCKDYLISHGIDSARLVSKGWGDTKPFPGLDSKSIRNMKTEEERETAYAFNRRAEFRVLRFNYDVKAE